jgi:hypothetical protein
VREYFLPSNMRSIYFLSWVSQNLKPFWNTGSETTDTWFVFVLKITLSTQGTVSLLVGRNSCVKLLCALLYRISNCFTYFRSASYKFPSVISHYANSACDTSRSGYTILPFSHFNILWEYK